MEIFPSMKPASHLIRALIRALPVLVLACAPPARAEVIYSGQLDITIPKDFDGVYLNVLSGTVSGSEFSGWHINPIFGGIGVLNHTPFQPLRQSAAGDATLSNLSPHTLVSSESSFYATGMGASDSHLGTTFAAGTEGYLGFSVVNGAATDHGWMRVVFTGTGSPLIRDWAYTTSGGSIGVGNVLQNGSTYTLDSTARDFTLASAIGGANHVVVNGSNTVTLSGTHGYSGTTAINTGTLALSSGASIANSPTITVGADATLDVSALSGGWTFGAGQTLTGTGSVIGNATIAGIHAPGGSIGMQTINGNVTYDSASIFEWEMNYDVTERGIDYDAVNIGDQVSGNNSVFKILLPAQSDFEDAFWNSDRSWADIFTGLDGTTVVDGWAGIFNSFAYFNGDGEIAEPGSRGAFTLSGNTLSWTAIPEPTTALVALLLALGTLRRHRS